MRPATETKTLRILDRAGADALIAHIMQTMRALEEILTEEGGHVRAGRLRQGLSQTERKTALAAAYMQGLEVAKANAIALARFAPDAVEGLKAAHRRFAEVVETSQVVLATARTVSESLVKSLAEDMNRSRTTTVYGRPSQPPSPYGKGAAGRSQPLVLSRSL
ncbi:hypothetical protein [Methylobacterium marchantiae]|uniref:Flagellar protein FlgN n=1 Tax=Methylobacterium marchantiae TaxID=600331 RepID=A0ABW3X010_9HYPH|nr:hypothetical protein AIGOOFII_1031 [Methylobacterium marchantiae]